MQDIAGFYMNLVQSTDLSWLCRQHVFGWIYSAKSIDQTNLLRESSRIPAKHETHEFPL